MPISAISAPDLVGDDAVLATAALLLVGVVATGLAVRLRVPSLVLVLVAGMIVADDGLAWIRFDDAELAQNLSAVALAIILYEGGLATRRRDLTRVAGPAGLLATVGVAVTAAVVAGTVVAFTDVPASTAWIVGAVVASTDAAAVFAAVRSTRLPQRVGSTLSIESGLNDPIAVLLTVGTIAAAEGGVSAGDWVVFGVRQLVLGAVVGGVVGVVGGVVVQRVRLTSSALQAVLALAVGLAAYGVTSTVGGSAFLAAFVSGVAVAEMAPSHRRSVRLFHQGLAEAAQIGLFFLLGVLVFPSAILDDAGVALLVAASLVLVARPLAVVVCLLWFRFTARELVVVSWAGLRGAVPIVLATYPLTAGVPDGRLVFDVVFFVVLLSALVQGGLLAPLATRLGVVDRSGPAGVSVELTPLGSAHADVAEAELEDGHPYVGRTLAEIAPPPPTRVVLIGRDGRTVIPDGATRLAAGDVLVIGGRDGAVDVVAAERWLNGDRAAADPDGSPGDRHDGDA
jgi:cell volume regulation protein A